MTDWFTNNAQYTQSVNPTQLTHWPNSSLVRVYPEGKTQPGWGAKNFIVNQKAGKFRPSRILDATNFSPRPFAIVMRSIPMVCIDIDGKNGGIKTAMALALPVTLAERSKSGNGYHLFYSLSYPNWNQSRGYDEVDDQIGIVPGVDIKGTGVVYHYPHQLWNQEDVAPLPTDLREMFGDAKAARLNYRLTRGVNNLDEDELVILHDELKSKLKKSAPAGERNNHLYAVGASMYAADYEDWDLALYDRGNELGLEIEEVTTIIKNITRYAR